MDPIAHDELRKVIEDDLDTLVIDVLPRESYESAHIAGAINVPIGEPGFVDRVQRQTTGRDQDIVVYCGSEDCVASREASDALTNAGFTRVRTYTGGLGEWQALGHPMTSGSAAL